MYGKITPAAELVRTYSPDSSSTLCKAAHAGKGSLNSGNAIGDLLNVAAEFLPKSQGSGVLIALQFSKPCNQFSTNQDIPASECDQS
jgi:hypothetical protein